MNDKNRSRNIEDRQAHIYWVISILKTPGGGRGNVIRTEKYRRIELFCYGDVLSKITWLAFYMKLKRFFSAGKTLSSRSSSANLIILSKPP